MNSRPYADSYARYKGSSNVDLTLTGDMLENMFVKTVNNDSITISVRERDYGKLRGAQEGVKRVRRDAKGNKTGTYKVRRPFFSLSKNDRDTITNSDDFKRTLQKAVKRVLKEKQEQ